MHSPLHDVHVTGCRGYCFASCAPQSVTGMSSTQSESPLAACVSSHVCMMDASRRKSSSREWLLLPWIAELFAEVEIGISENQGTSLIFGRLQVVCRFSGFLFAAILLPIPNLQFQRSGKTRGSWFIRHYTDFGDVDERRSIFIDRHQDVIVFRRILIWRWFKMILVLVEIQIWNSPESCDKIGRSM